MSGAHRAGRLIDSSCLADAIKRPLRRVRVTRVVRESAAKTNGGFNCAHRACRRRGDRISGARVYRRRRGGAPVCAASDSVQRRATRDSRDRLTTWIV